MELHENPPHVFMCVCVCLGGASETWYANRQRVNEEANSLFAVVLAKVPDIKRADVNPADKTEPG